MIAQSPVEDMPKESEGNAARGLRAHAIGLIGANLVVGSLILWALPLLARFWHLSVPGILQRLLMPLAASDGAGTVALVYDAIALAAMVAGIALVIRAARLLSCRTAA